METYDDYSKEIRMINKFKKTNQSLLKPNKVVRKSTDEPKSCRLLKLLLLNAEKITETMKEQQEKIENTIKGLEKHLEKSEFNFMQELKNFSNEFAKLKENINENMSNKKSKSVLEYFQVKQEANCKKKDVNNVEILNLVSKNKGYRGVKEIIEKCDEKVKALKDLKEKVKSSVIDEDFLGNKRKSEREVNKKKSVSSSDEEKETINRDNNNKDNRSPLLKMCINYFNKNKPTSSILIPHRKRIFVNYYLDDSKRTTKSFNIAHVRSLKEFKNLLEEVKLFIRTHKVTKE
jgi:hypothetical protein